MLYAQQGRYEQALGLLRRALAQEPDSVALLNHAGAALNALHRYDEALACFDKAVAHDGDDIEALYNRGTALQALGRRADAIASYAAAIAIEPDFAAARLNLGSVLQSLGRQTEAVDQYRKALAAEPDYARAHVALASALEAQGHHDEAIAHYEKALAVEPANADTHNDLGLALQAVNRLDEAIAHHRAAISLRPGFGAAHNNLAMALQALNRHDDAIEEYRKAVAAPPPQARRFANLGVALQEIGRLDEACRAFETAIELEPRTGRFYRNLADCKRFTAGDPYIAAMENLARDREQMPEEDRRQLLFALGKALADVELYERSFGYLLEGNALKRRQVAYDEAKTLAEFKRIEAVFDRGLMDRLRNLGDPSPVPVFIVGMPRSGTTLVEQILASHPKVFGAGELPDFGRAVAQLSGPARFPELVPHLSGEQLRELGSRYLEGIVPAAAGAERITDKMPLNFFFNGLIHLALPNARIIHTRRDPVDTCFSCFATLFTGDHRVAYGLSDLGRYYQAYAALMDHWRRVMPEGAVLEVEYELLAADFEPNARRIVAHCGLAWDDACLEFHRARRPVRTASMAQVRRPIYQSSIGRWQRYRHLLGPLLDALGVDGAGAPAQR